MVNIFVSHYNPRTSAQAQPTLLLQRMCLEAVEVLCAVHWNLRLGDGPTPNREKVPDNPDAPAYRRSLSQRKHPIVRWAGADRSNYTWVLKHIEAMAEEHVLRYNNEKPYPKTYVENYQWLVEHQHEVPTVRRQRIVKASSLDYYGAFNEKVFRTLSPDIRVQYRLSLIHKWDYLYTRNHNWGFRGPPDWYYHKPYTLIVRELFGPPTTKIALAHRKELQHGKRS